MSLCLSIPVCITLVLPLFPSHQRFSCSDSALSKRLLARNSRRFFFSFQFGPDEQLVSSLMKKQENIIHKTSVFSLHVNCFLYLISLSSYGVLDFASSALLWNSVGTPSQTTKGALEHNRQTTLSWCARTIGALWQAGLLQCVSFRSKEDAPAPTRVRRLRPPCSWPQCFPLCGDRLAPNPGVFPRLPRHAAATSCQARADHVWGCWPAKWWRASCLRELQLVPGRRLVL